MGIRIRDFFDESNFTFKDLNLFKEAVDYLSKETESYSSFVVYYEKSGASLENNLDRIGNERYTNSEKSELILKGNSSGATASALAA